MPSIATVILAIAVFLLPLALIVRPLVGRPELAVRPPGPDELLDQERGATVRAIRELDDDYRTGKLNAEDYATLRSGLVTRGAELLQRMEASVDLAAPEQDARDAAIEEQIRRARGRL